MTESNQDRDWSTPLCNCIQDPEVCWWTVWCPCIISARTAEVFERRSSTKLMYIALSAFGLAFVLAQFQLYETARHVVSIYGLYYLFQRANVRFEIRQKLQIFTTSQPWLYDLCVHYFCNSCATCQEAREGNIVTKRNLDYCSGQNLEELSPPSHHDDIEDQLSYSDVPNQSISTSSWESFITYQIWSLFYQQRMSNASKLLFPLVILGSVYGFIHLSFINAFNAILIVCIFLQPTIILSVMLYCRQWRKYVQMDYIFKLFLVGFFMATTQSFVFEIALQVIVAIIFGDSSSADGDQSNNDSSNVQMMTMNEQAAALNRNWVIESIHYYNQQQGLVFPNILQWFYPANTTNMEYFLSPIPEVPIAIGSDVTWSGLQDIATSSTSATPMMLLKLVGRFFVSAFVIAAGVEETMKHFVVKCCKFPYHLKNPYIITMYFLVGALGFATAENMLYVLKLSLVPLDVTVASDIFWIELFIFIMRILTPIHLICATLQAVNFTKVREDSIAFSHNFVFSVE
jgi:Cys-rich protein (TIGR01571 family)